MVDGAKKKKKIIINEGIFADTVLSFSSTAESLQRHLFLRSLVTRTQCAETDQLKQ